MLVLVNMSSWRGFGGVRPQTKLQTAPNLYVKHYELKFLSILEWQVSLHKCKARIEDFLVTSLWLV